ncbi:MAG: glycerate kinase [Myxococcota bacterium]|nr:glycerate kinase [Myxococcota bacterium]
MKIVIAPDSFKESLTAREVCEAIEAGFRLVLPRARYVQVPVADGGEGTMQALVDASGGRLERVRVTGPLGDPVEARFGMLGDGRTAVVEMAEASGLQRVPPDRRDPMRASSYGTGELIRAALERGVGHLIVGIGGSATNDGGAGMAQALGVALRDRAGREIGRGGGALAELERIDASQLDPRLDGVRIEAACDVTNPLSGERGASAVFGPQKGATPAMVAELDANLAHFGTLIERQCGAPVVDVPGAGAAGGLGAGLLGLLGARLRPGVEIVLDAVGMDAHVEDADLVVTGEGRIDGQSVHGKTPCGVAYVARRAGARVIAMAGSLGDGFEAVYEHGIDAVFAAAPGPIALDEALRDAAHHVRRTARNAAAALAIGRQLPRARR